MQELPEGGRSMGQTVDTGSQRVSEVGPYIQWVGALHTVGGVRLLGAVRLASCPFFVSGDVVFKGFRTASGGERFGAGIGQ